MCMYLEQNLNGRGGPVGLAASIDLPLLMEYPPCVSPVGAHSGSWSDKGVEHTSCRQGHLQGSDGILRVHINRSRVLAMERLVHHRFCGARACTSDEGEPCPSVREIILALMASSDQRGLPRCAHISPSDPLNLVFVGDSITFRSFNAAACSLLAGGHSEVSPPQYIGSHLKTEVYKRIHGHPAFRALRRHIAGKHSVSTYSLL